MEIRPGTQHGYLHGLWHLRAWAMDPWLCSTEVVVHVQSPSLSKALGKIGTPDTAVGRSNEGVMHLMSSLPLIGIMSRLPGSTTTHFIKPTNLIGLFQDHYPLQFRLRFGADTQEVGAFWARFFDSTVRARWVDQHMFLRGKVQLTWRKQSPL